MSSQRDTIAAIATAPGEGGISVIRISGAESHGIADRIFSGKSGPPSRQPAGTFHFGFVRSDGEVVDEVLLLLFRAPRSYTGEDTIELHAHGGSVQSGRVLKAVLAAGARIAEPGEFTRRAFLNGRMDLLQAEAVADLVRARTDMAARAALGQLSGRASAHLRAIYEEMIGLSSDLEAALDFPEDELPPYIRNELVLRMDEVKGKISACVATWEEGRMLRDGVTVVISGRPNVGKSTLLNGLLGVPKAIVSPHPGTTRDVIEAGMQIAGYPVLLMDTAGIRDTTCEIEQEGISRAVERVSRADVCIYIVDMSRDKNDEDVRFIQRLEPEKLLLVLSKRDLERRLDVSEAIYKKAVVANLCNDADVLNIREALAGMLREKYHKEAEMVVSMRHKCLMEKAIRNINSAREAMEADFETGVLPAANEMRDAARDVGRIVGRVYDEDLLDSIFSRFCIGK